ncbi:MAG TPA: LamG-like jellyroll fold domain-containing protein, partial [Verrucomicrobiae bacterium]|nr:LamG-like jellyroll fold domain-containing protein [Verrucomicrobiae bacterium]
GLPGWGNFVALADLDGDGKLDIAVVTQLGNSFSLFRNISSPGSFSTASLAPRIDLPAGYNPNGVVIGDLNGDGRPDVVFANSYDNTLSVCQNVSPMVTNPPPSCTAAPSGLVAWWPGEGNANDIIGGNNGELEGGVTFAAGEVGQAFAFNGTTAGVEIPASPGLNVGTNGGLTIEGWVSPTAISNADQWLFGWKNPPDNYGTDVKLTQGGPAGNVLWNVKDTFGNNHVLISGAVLSNNLFQHLALTYDQATGVATIYCNGTVVAQQTLGSFTADTTEEFFLGTRASSNPLENAYEGLLDEVSVYSRALSQSEIAAIYHAGSTGKCFVPVPPMITAQPTNESVVVGGTASFSVAASGSPTLTYQWYNGSGSIDGATNSTLTLSDVQLSAAGNYYVTVSNPYGATNSTSASLTVSNPPPPSCTPAPSGITAWWRAEDNTIDSVNGNNGVFIGTASYAPGEVGQAFNFNGSSYVQMPDNPTLHFTNGMSVEAWINLNHYTGNNTDILVKYDALAFRANSYALSIEGASTHRAYFTVVDTNFNGNQLFSSVAIPTNQWVHIAGTYDGVTMNIYVNGILSGSAAQPNGMFQGTRPLTIGASLNGGPVSFFAGEIDEASLYNRGLTAGEVQAIYNAGSAGKCSSNAPPVSVAPVITSINPSSGLAGSPVTITGSNFAATAAGDIVYFGAVQAAVTAGNTSSLTAIAPTNATFGPISVTVGGLTGYSEPFYLPDFKGAGPLTN